MKPEPLNKLEWDEFFGLWSSDNAGLTDGQLSRQQHLYNFLRGSAPDKFARCWNLANKARWCREWPS
jgi:hypothetical protein